MTQSKDLNARFGANLRRERHTATISQEALAYRAGLHPSEIALLEHGRRSPTLGTIVKLAGGLKISPAVLVEGMTRHAAPSGRDGHFEVAPS